MHQMAALTPVRVGGASRRAPSTRRTQVSDHAKDQRKEASSGPVVGDTCACGRVAYAPSPTHTHAHIDAHRQRPLQRTQLDMEHGLPGARGE
jgi:hypothetical protein